MSVEPAPTDHSVLDLGERLVDVIAPLVPDPQTTRPLLPTECALRHPAVAPQLLSALDAPAGQARHDPALSEALAQFLVIFLSSSCHLVIFLSSYALSACSFRGRRRGLPRLPRTDGIASTVASSRWPSGTLAPESTVASGRPFLSTAWWRLVPGLPRSTGDGPTARLPVFGLSSLRLEAPLFPPPSC